jgi:hypothetical protein
MEVSRGDAQTSRGGRPEVVEDHIGLGHQFQVRLAALRFFQVKLDPSLSLVHGDESQRKDPIRVSLGRLDLEHVSAVASQ